MSKVLKKTLCILMISILLCTVSLLTQTSTVMAAGKTYYVDSINGNDSNSGTDSANAWKSLTKVNGTTFTPGDKILFKAGGSWSGILHPLGSGTSGSPITIDMYGSGNKPIINGNGGDYAVLLLDQEFWTIQNLEIINDASTEARRNAILVRATGAKLYDGITIKNCNIHNVKGLPNWCTDKWYSAAIQFDGATGATANVSGFKNILVEGNYIHDITCGGIFHFAQANSQVVTIRNNTIDNTGCDSIVMCRTDELMINNNSVFDSGINGHDMFAIAGVFPTACKNTYIQNNEIARTVLPPETGYDGQGMDADLHLDGVSVWQYNYSHENQGGFFMIMDQQQSTLSNIIVRYNISLYDHNGEIQCKNASKAVFYNNNVYNPNGPVKIWSYNFDTSGAYFGNNIFVGDGTSSYQGNFTYDTNCYSGHTGPNSDTNKVQGDPRFVSPNSCGDGRNICNNYKLLPDSPCIDAGTSIGFNGGYDFFGNTVYYGNADIGAYESRVSKTTDWLNDWLKTYSHTAGWQFDTTNPTNFYYDVSRICRTSLTTQNVVWNNGNGLSYFTATMYYYTGADTSKIKFYSSADNINWTQITVSNVTNPTQNGWTKLVTKPLAASLPSGTKYIKMELSSTSGASWDIQLGVMDLMSGV